MTQRDAAVASTDVMPAPMRAMGDMRAIGPVRLSRPVLATILALAVGAVQAQAGHAGHGAHGNGATASPSTAATAASTTASADLAEGVVRRVDAAGGRVTIKHGEIVALGMPPMTMVFRAKDPSLLQGLKVGDTIRFKAEQDGSNYILMSVEPVR
jgi:Cu(I)/Ag(I) efflux system periplasmic protein CusF